MASAAVGALAVLAGGPFSVCVPIMSSALIARVCGGVPLGVWVASVASAEIGGLFAGGAFRVRAVGAEGRPVDSFAQ